MFVPLLYQMCTKRTENGWAGKVVGCGVGCDACGGVWYVWCVV